MIVVSTKFLPELRKLPDEVLSRNEAIVEVSEASMKEISALT